MKTEREIELEKQVERYKCALEKGPGFVEPALYERTRRERNAARVQVAALRGALAEVLNSASPHPAEHPAMTRAWRKALAALADPNLGADWVPRAELEEQQRQYAENLAGREQQYQAELRRVSEAVLDRVFDLLSNACLFEEHQGIAVARRYVNDVRRDLDAIVRGGK